MFQIIKLDKVYIIYIKIKNIYLNVQNEFSTFALDSEKNLGQNEAFIRCKMMAFKIHDEHRGAIINYCVQQVDIGYINQTLLYCFYKIYMHIL